MKRRSSLLASACLICLINGPFVLNWPPIREILERDEVYGWLCEEGISNCPNQKKALALLATLSQIMMFVGSVIGGILTDTFGSRFSTTLGSSLFAFQFALLSMCSKDLPLYLLCFVMNGLAIEITFFGLLPIANLFNDRQGLALSLMGSFRSISLGYGILQSALASRTSFTAMNLTCMAAAVLAGLLGFLVLPKQPPLSTPAVDLEAATEQVTELKLFAKKACHPAFIAWLLFFGTSYARLLFYTISINEQHPHAVTAYSILTPLSFIPCPIIGILADTVGMFWVLGFLNSIAACLYACLLMHPVLAIQLTAVVCSCLLNSFLSSQNYCYVSKYYPKSVQGRLSGLAMLVAGGATYLNTPMYNFAIDTNGFDKINQIYFAATLGLYVLLGYIIMHRETTKSVLMKKRVVEDCGPYEIDSEDYVKAIGTSSTDKN